MSEQTAKIAKVRENINSYPNKMDKTGKNPTVYVHGITVEGDAIEWQYHSISQSCTAFVPGQEATFTTEVKVNGNYTNHKIVPVKAEKKSFGGGFGGSKFEPRNQEVISGLSAVSTATNFYAQRGQATEEQVLTFAEKIYQWAMSKSKK